jgi:L-threonylcarbamoyladenylate synthase
MKAETPILPINHPDAISRAASIIKGGGVIAFPTDTVYGVGASAFQKAAIDRIYKIKERSKEKAIPILIGDPGELSIISSPPNQQIIQLMDQFWPGALTLIFPIAPDLPNNLSTSATIGVRIPDHELTRQLLRATGPLAATSANLSGEESALSAQDVSQILGSKIDLILDGGRSKGGEASTVLDLTGADPVILRVGPITLDDIKPYLV